MYAALRGRAIGEVPQACHAEKRPRYRSLSARKAPQRLDLPAKGLLPFPDGERTGLCLLSNDKSNGLIRGAVRVTREPPI